MKVTTIPAILNMAMAAPLVIQGAFTRLVMAEFSGQPIETEQAAQQLCDTTGSPDVAAAFFMFKPYRDAIKACAAVQQTRKRVASKAAADRWAGANKAQNSGEKNASSIAEHPSSIAEHASSIAPAAATQPVVPAVANPAQENASSIAEHRAVGNPPIPPSPLASPLPPYIPPKKHADACQKATGVSHESADALNNPDNFALTQPDDSGGVVPVQAIVDLYHRILPTAGRVDVLSDARVKAIKARWAEVPKRRRLSWWQGLFEHIRDNSTFLMGNAPPGRNRERPFRLTIDFVTHQQRLTEITEGKFDDDK